MAFWVPCIRAGCRGRLRGETSATAAGAGAVVVGAGDGGLSGGQRHAVADGYGDADLLGHGHDAAAAVGLGDAVDAGASLAGHGDGAHGGGGSQHQRRGDVHALGAGFAASAGRTALLRRAAEERLMFICFTDTQSDPSFPGEPPRAEGAAVPEVVPLWGTLHPMRWRDGLRLGRRRSLLSL